MLGLLVIFFFFLIYLLFINFWQLSVSVAACSFSLLVENEGYSLVAAREPVIVMVSLVGEHRPWSVQVSLVVAPKLSGLVTRGIFLDKGLNQHFLH